MNAATRATPLALAALLLASPARARQVEEVLAEGLGRALGEVLASALAEAIDAPEPASQPQDPFTFEELHDWADPETDSTVRTRAGCDGLVVATTLTGTVSENFVNVIYQDQADVPVSSRLLRAWVSLGRGTWHLPYARPAVVHPNQTHTTSFALPRKEDFADQRVIELALMFARSEKVCTLNIRYERTRLQEPRTYIRHTGFDFWFAVGERLATSGGLQSLRGYDEGQIEFGMAAFPWVHHGLTVDLLLNYGGERSGTRVDNEGVVFGHVVRSYPLSWLWLSYGTSVGSISSRVRQDTETQGLETLEQVWSFAIQQRLRLELRLIGGSVMIAPSLSYLHVLNGRLEGRRLYGSSLTASVALGGSF